MKKTHQLSNPEVLKELFETFVKMDWIKKVDFSKAEHLNNTFISKKYQNI